MINNQHLDFKFLQVFCFLIPREILGGLLGFCCNFLLLLRRKWLRLCRTVMKAVTKNNFKKWQNCNCRQDDLKGYYLSVKGVFLPSIFLKSII